MSRRARNLLLFLVLSVAFGTVWYALSPGPEVLRCPREELVQREDVWYLKDSDQAFTGVMFEANGEDKLLSEIPLREGLAHGIARGWYPSGQLEIEEPFSQGKSHGTRTRYHENGKIRSIARTVQGVLDGPFKEYHDNGQMAVEMTLVEGVGQGLSRAWHPSGKLKAEVTLMDGEPTDAIYYEDK
jgi:antitoxin component YwqK of YwqJK toxin-antitoxin module